MSKQRTGVSGSKAALDRRIEAKLAQIERLDERIADLMHDRVERENELSDLYRRRNAMLPENQPGADALS